MDRRLLILALGMFALGSDSFVIAGILPKIAHTFDVSVGVAGQMTTAYALSYAILAPTVAAFAHAVPRKRLLLAALTCFVLGNLGTAAAPTFAVAIVARVFAGLGAAMYAPTATGAATTIVPVEKRGFALSVVITGLTASTALGSPIGALIGGLGDWRYTMVFVSLIGIAAALGIAAMLHHIPTQPSAGLLERFKPLTDPRVSLTVLTTLLTMCAVYTVYTYFSVVFDRVLAGGPFVLTALLVVWGVAGAVGNLGGGYLVDRVGTQRVLFGTICALGAVMAFIPWASATFWPSLVAMVIWGVAGWGVQAPQQHRLVSLNPAMAPVVLGLNTAGTYFGVAIAGIIGAYGLATAGAYNLPYVGLALVFASFGSATLALLAIHKRRRADLQAAAVSL